MRIQGTSRALAAAGLCGLLACVTGCGAPSPELELRKRHHSLCRLAADAGLLDGDDAAVEVITREGDARVSLIQRVGFPLRVGPIPRSGGCVLRFALGFGRIEPAYGNLELHITAEGAERSEQVFRESIDPREAQHGDWVERELPLDLAAEGPVALLLEARLGEGARAPSGGVGWGSPEVVCDDPRPPARTTDRPNIVLISIDTLRADHLGVYGYPRTTSPTLDALAQESLVFDNAFATSPWTLPSHASLLTGLYPEEHGAGHAYPTASLRPDIRTVTERLAAAGYRTIAHTGGGHLRRERGLDRGFEDWTERRAANLRSAFSEVFDALASDLSKPVFLFLHTYDVHAPYIQPREYARFLTAPGEPSAWPAEALAPAQWEALGKLGLHEHLDLARFEGIGDVKDAYDSSLFFVDAQLAILFAYLEQLGIFENTLLIVTSDHGESFLERGPYISHGYTFFDEEIRVPLIIRTPGGAQRGRREELVDLTDLAALILETAGVDHGEGLSGASPLARMEGRSPPRRFVRGGSALTGGLYARGLSWKVIAAVPEQGAAGNHPPGQLIPGFELSEQVFQVATDPAERANRADDGASLPEEVWIMRQLLGETEPPGREQAPADSLSPQRVEELRALGYVELGEGTEPSPPSNRSDPAR